MKNFKKVLALVLAVVMLLSFATVASAKIVTSDFYKDTDDIDYTEAVDVLGSIGVLNGFPDDTFRPDATITRAQAAKIIAMFDNGSSSINGLYASANPFTDCVDNWAESFIAYCAKVGIIAGVGGTKFAPDANVTGVQFLKMALVVLGYDAKVEGLEGKNWDVNTLALAKKAGLTASLGVKFDYSADLKRQEAAVIMLDALRAQTVVYGSALGVNVNKFNAAVKDWLDNTSTNPYQFEGLSINGAVYMTVAGAVKTGEKLGADWGLSEGYTEDAFYRPYRTWELKGVGTVGTYMYPVLAEYTTAYDGCDVLVDLGVAKTNISKTVTIDELYINGFKRDGRDIALKHTVESAAECAAKGFVSGAQGTLSQVFYVNDGYRITEIDTWLGYVESAKRVSSNRDGHLSTYTKSQIKVYGDETYHADNHGDFRSSCIGGDLIKHTSVDGLSTGDYVLVTYSVRDDGKYGFNAAGLVDVEVTKPVAGTFSGYKTNYYPSQTRVDGEYKMDAVHFHLGYDASKSDGFGAKRFFYDAYGNVIGMLDPAAGDTNYLVIDRLWVTHDAKGNAVLYADVVGLDAKMTENVVVKTANNGVADRDAQWFADQGEREYEQNNRVWYDKLKTFSVDADGKYTIKVADYDVYNNVVITSGDPNAKATAANYDFIIDNNTQFLIHETDGSYSAVTGYKNIKSLTANVAQVVDANEDDVAEIVYLTGVVYEGDKVVAYVPHEADIWKLWNENGVVYYGITVYVKGVAVDLYIDAATYAQIDTAAETGTFYLFHYRTGANGTYAEVVTATLEDMGLTKVELVSDAVKAGVLKYTETVTNADKSAAIADDVALYSIRYNVNDGVVVEKVDYLENVAGHDAYISFSAGQVAEIYVVETIAD